MFGSFRAGGIAAATALLSATIVGAGPSQALDLQAPAAVSGALVHEVVDSKTVAFAATQESPQVAVSVQAAPIADHADITIDGAAEAARAVAPVLVSPGVLVPVIPAVPPKKQRATLAAMVAEHRGTTVPDRERECLAGAIYFESKGEPLPGQVAVGQVIANRAKSGRFPKSWCGVVFQRSQFSFVRGGGLPPIPRASAHWKTAVAVAHIVANDLHDAVVPKALFFHARYVSPNWKKVSKVATVGNHIFYR